MLNNFDEVFGRGLLSGRYLDGLMLPEFSLDALTLRLAVDPIHRFLTVVFRFT